MLGKIVNVIRRDLDPARFFSTVKYARHLGVRVGEGCHFGKITWGTEPYLITVGDHVLMSSNITFINHDGGTSVFRRLPGYECVINKFGTIRIGNNCFIGAGVTILPNVKIGNNCVIGAKALVTKSVPDGEVWGGVPARRLMSVEEFAEKCKNGPGCIPIPGGKNKKEILLKAFADELSAKE